MCFTTEKQVQKTFQEVSIFDVGDDSPKGTEPSKKLDDRRLCVADDILELRLQVRSVQESLP